MWRTHTKTIPILFNLDFVFFSRDQDNYFIKRILTNKLNRYKINFHVFISAFIEILVSIKYNFSDLMIAKGWGRLVRS